MERKEDDLKVALKSGESSLIIPIIWDSIMGVRIGGAKQG